MVLWNVFTCEIINDNVIQTAQIRANYDKKGTLFEFRIHNYGCDTCDRGTRAATLITIPASK